MKSLIGLTVVVVILFVVVTPFTILHASIGSCTLKFLSISAELKNRDVGFTLDEGAKDVVLTVGGPLAKKSAAKRRALLPAWERRAEPWSMISTEGTTPVARLGDGTALGATPSRLGAAEGVSSGLTARVKTAR